MYPPKVQETVVAGHSLPVSLIGATPNHDILGVAHQMDELGVQLAILHVPELIVKTALRRVAEEFVTTVAAALGPEFEKTHVCSNVN